jgi:hypothetical protein
MESKEPRFLKRFGLCKNKKISYNRILQNRKEVKTEPFKTDFLKPNYNRITKEIVKKPNYNRILQNQEEVAKPKYSKPRPVAVQAVVDRFYFLGLEFKVSGFEFWF